MAALSASIEALAVERNQRLPLGQVTAVVAHLAPRVLLLPDFRGECIQQEVREEYTCGPTSDGPLGRSPAGAVDFDTNRRAFIPGQPPAPRRPGARTYRPSIPLVVVDLPAEARSPAERPNRLYCPTSLTLSGVASALRSITRDL